MKTTGTTIKLGIVWLVLSVFTVMIIVVFGQVRFHHTTGYSAVFTHVSGLRAGQFVRAAGVEVGKVAKVTLIDGDKQVSTGTSKYWWTSPWIARCHWIRRRPPRSATST